MYNHYYNPRGYGMSFRRSLGFACGHAIAHALVKQGTQTMHAMLEDKHKFYRNSGRVEDAEFIDLGRGRRAYNHTPNSFASSVNKPRANITVVQHKTPVYKIAFWMLVGAAGFAWFGTDWFTKTPSNIIGYYYTPSGERLCLTKSYPPSIWDDAPTVCPKGK